MLQYLIQGFLLGVAYVVPIGTQNIFVINTAITQKRLHVIITAGIVAFFDISLSIACFYGVGLLINDSIVLKLLFLFLGGTVVLFIGIGLLKSQVGSILYQNVDLSVKKIIITSCVVTWFNPQALIDGTMLLGASYAMIPFEYRIVFIVSCTFASLIWWFGMSITVNCFKTKISEKILRVVSSLCGFYIVLYACKLLWNGIMLFL